MMMKLRDTYNLKIENMFKNKRTAAAATVFDHPPPLEVDMDLRFKER